MVAFLEKCFEFTTTLSMEECVARLKAKSTRKSGFFASRQEILVRISDDVNGKSFILDRDWGRNLYAEVHGHLIKNHDGSTRVSGFGRPSLVGFLLSVGFSIIICLIIYLLRDDLRFAVFPFSAIIMLWLLELVTLSNRNNLIYIVEQTLGIAAH